MVWEPHPRLPLLIAALGEGRYVMIFYWLAAIETFFSVGMWYVFAVAQRSFKVGIAIAIPYNDYSNTEQSPYVVHMNVDMLVHRTEPQSHRDTEEKRKVIDYSYDRLSRLIEADYNNGATVYNYGYDVAGNMVDYDGVTRTYNAANQMSNDGTNSLTYDNNGNLRTVGSDTYTWDRANRLLSVGNHSYVYDGLGNRVQQTVSSVVTDYLNDIQPGLTKLLKQITGSSVEQFVHGVRGIHAVDDGTDWNFYAQDGLGSVRALVDDAGLVQSSMGYDPYGNPMGAYGEGFGFTGEQTGEDGSVFLRARYYEPNLGSFIKRDPAETPNRYAYVSGNPVNRVDPTGLFDWCTGTIQEGDTLGTLASVLVIRAGDDYRTLSQTERQRRWDQMLTRLSDLNPNHPITQQGIGNYNIRLNTGQPLDPNWPSINLGPEMLASAEVTLGISCRPMPQIDCPPDTITIIDPPVIEPPPATPRQQCSHLAPSNDYFNCCVEKCNYHNNHNIDCVRECAGLNDNAPCSPTGLIEFNQETYGFGFGASVYNGFGAGSSVIVLTDGTGRYVVFSGVDFGVGMNAAGSSIMGVWSEASLDEFAGFSINGNVGIGVSATSSVSLDGLCNQTYIGQFGVGASTFVSSANYVTELTDIISVIELIGLDGEAARIATEMLAPQN